MGHGSGLFSVVRRYCRHRRLARILIVARRALLARDRRIGRLPLQWKDPGRVRSGSGPGVRKLSHGCRSRVRPGTGGLFRWHANGTIRMASLLHRPGRRQHGLAGSLVPMGTARRDRHIARGERRRRISPTSEATINVGDLRWSVWRKLCAVLRDHLAANLSHPRTPFLDGNDGENWRCRILVLRRSSVDLRLGLRPVDCSGRNAHARSQDLYQCGSRGRRAAPSWLRSRWSRGCGDSATAGVCRRWDVRFQYLGDHANACGASDGGRWTGFQNFLGNLAGFIVPVVTGFVIDYTGHFLAAFVIMAIVGLLASVSYIFVIGPVKQIAWQA